MKFFYVTLIAAGACGSTTLAQNVLPSSGNAGIGTTTPTTALDVRGIISTPEIAFRNADGGDDTDPYRLRKVQVSPDNNYLELQLNVSIGTTSSQGYKLAVAGPVIAESVKVKLQANWPDYVFATEHRLPSLSELERYIKQNRRLPEIPSAEEALKEGIDLGEMNAKLLKKIEELTLYIIEQDKKNANQDSMIETMSDTIRRQQEMIEKLIKSKRL